MFRMRLRLVVPPFPSSVVAPSFSPTREPAVFAVRSFCPQFFHNTDYVCLPDTYDPHVDQPHHLLHHKISDLLFLPHHPSAPSSRVRALLCPSVFSFLFLIPHPQFTHLLFFFLFVGRRRHHRVCNLLSGLAYNRCAHSCMRLIPPVLHACIAMDIGLVPEPTSQVPEAGTAERSEGIIGSQFKWCIQWTLAHWISPVTGRQWVQWTDLRDGKEPM